MDGGKEWASMVDGMIRRWLGGRGWGGRQLGWWRRRSRTVLLFGQRDRVIFWYLEVGDIIPILSEECNSFPDCDILRAVWRLISPTA